MYKKIAIAALSMALLVGTAFAQYTVTNAGPVNSAGAIGNAENGVFTSTYTGSSSLYGSLTISGDLTEVIGATWASEAGFRINPVGSSAFGDFFPSDLDDLPGTLSVSSSFDGLFWFDNGTQYRYEAFESFSDGAGPDATWTNLSMNYSGSIITTDIGSFSLGTSLVFDTTGSDFDTELAGYSTTGTLLGTNDDNGSELTSLLNLDSLPVGDYYLVFGGFNSRFDNKFAVPGEDAGNYVINLNGNQVASGASEANKFQILKFQILGASAAPEPGTLALLGLVAIPGALVLRRRK